MKTKLTLLLGFILVSQNGICASLEISGTVPDRGFQMQNVHLNNQQLIPILNSNIKIFIADQLSPKKWKKLAGPLTLTQSSLVRVEAP